MLDDEMKALIACQSIGSVATVRADGSPAVSPKATFLVLDDSLLALSNIRSPGTIANLACDPRVEVNFIDPFHRMALRVTGEARYVEMSAVVAATRDRFRDAWPNLFALLHGVAFITVAHAKMLTSSSYDIGADANDLADRWLKHFADDLGFIGQRR